MLLLEEVANFEFVDESKTGMEEEAVGTSTEKKAPVNNPERVSFWEELLKDKFEVQKVEEFNSMGKGKRSRKQMISVEEDDLAGLEDVSSDGEDDNYEVELTGGENVPAGAPQLVRRPYRKRSRGEGRSFRVLGFNQNHRAVFVQVLMRFGLGEYDWAEFTQRSKQKSYEEIKDYKTLFLSHIAEDITDSPTFSEVRAGTPMYFDFPQTGESEFHLDFLEMYLHLVMKENKTMLTTGYTVGIGALFFR